MQGKLCPCFGSILAAMMAGMKGCLSAKCPDDKAAVGATTMTLDRPFDAIGNALWFSRNATIFDEGEAVKYLYKIESGFIRTFRTLVDGRRPIDAFYIPGDVFGLESRDKHAVSAEAITRCRIHLVKMNVVFALAEKDFSIANFLLAEAFAEMRRAQTHRSILLKSAEERIVGFLLDMEKREGQTEIELPMTRGDIADHLGLTTETVSRILWKLEKLTAIAVKRRSVALRNRRVLNKING